MATGHCRICGRRRKSFDDPALHGSGRLTRINANGEVLLDDIEDRRQSEAVASSPVAVRLDETKESAAMPARKIVIIDGHPDPAADRYCHALASTYATAASSAGHWIRCIAIADMDMPRVPSKDAESEDAPPVSREAQDAISWADHLVIIYPLWLGSMPSSLKAFFEQTFWTGSITDPGKRPSRSSLVNGKSARIIITMTMPALVYRLLFFSHSIPLLKRNIRRFAGIGPTATTLIGCIEAIGFEGRQKWLRRVEKLARNGR